jgi:heme/copper-type cytochrome/quinol oxidase subunit 2
MRSLVSRTVVAAFATVAFCTLTAAADQPGRSNEERGSAVAARAVAPGQVKKFHVTASEGSIAPSIIRVNRGDHVEITFVSRDGSYGIKFKDFDVSTRVTPEKPAIVEFVPNEAGTFEFRCTRTWGVKRWTKNGTLVVK